MRLPVRPAPALSGLLVATWVACVYTAVLWAAGASSTHSSVPWGAHLASTVLVAATVVPVWRWVRPRADDLLQGSPEDAYRVLARVGRTLDTAPDGDLLTAVAGVVAGTIRLPLVAVLDAQGDVLARHGPAAAGPVVDVPVPFRGQVVATLRVGARSPHGISPCERRLLEELAPTVGACVAAAQAAAEAQSSRAELVRAREEERRRIRRDLHDGLGPVLASLRMQVAAVQRLLAAGGDDNRAGALRVLGELLAGTGEATAAVRTLVYGLRPPRLDELGLGGALSSEAAALRTSAGAATEVCVDVPVVRLPAAVEVALYRIACEALHNVARHAGASRCRVSLRVVNGQAELRVCDDGRGLPARLAGGVGLTAMRERAAELSGAVSVMPGRVSGTEVRAVLPLEPAGAGA